MSCEGYGLCSLGLGVLLCSRKLDLGPGSQFFGVLFSLGGTASLSGWWVKARYLDTEEDQLKALFPTPKEQAALFPPPAVRVLLSSRALPGRGIVLAALRN